MSSIRRRQRQSDYLVTVPSVWLEGDSPMPSTHVVKAWVPPTNIVFAILFGRERDLSQPDNIVNKLTDGASERRSGALASATVLKNEDGSPVPEVRA